MHNPEKLQHWVCKTVDDDKHNNTQHNVCWTSPYKRLKTKTNRTTNNKIYAGHLHNQDEDKQKNKHNAICGGTTIRNQTQIT
jgi:hypothetical protein